MILDSFLRLVDDFHSYNWCCFCLLYARRGRIMLSPRCPSVRLSVRLSVSNFPPALLILKALNDFEET